MSTNKTLFGLPIVENPALNQPQPIIMVSNLLKVFGELQRKATENDGGFIVPWIFCRQLQAMFNLEGRERGTIRAKRRYRAAYRAECRRLDAVRLRGINPIGGMVKE